MTNTISGEGRIIFPPLSMLSISPLNARRNDTAPVDELAALIKSQTLLQNLIVVPQLKGKKLIGYGVVGGGRRLRALQLLAERGDLEHDYPVPCIETDEAHAEAMSVAENSGRSPMHPADEFEAFKRMSDAGEPVEDIAAAFGVAPLIVRRRLQLAKVSPKLVERYRAGEMNLEQLQAFTLTDSHKLQEQVWDGAPQYMRHAQNLRQALTKGDIEASSDRRAKFIGLDAYEAAGGPVRRDLFGGTGSGYIGDVALLQKLTSEKLDAAAEALRAEGWSFVTVHEQIGWNETQAYGRSKPKTRELTADEQAEIARLEAVGHDSSEMLNADEDDQLTDGEADELNQAIYRANAQIVEIRARTETYSDRQKKTAGVVMGISHNGTLEIHRGMIKPVDKKAAAKKAAIAAGEEPEMKGHSEALVRKLTAHRTVAMQAHLADCPRLALATIVYALLSQILFAGGHFGAGAVRINAHRSAGSLIGAADDMETSRAWLEMDARREALIARLPESADGLLTWLHEQSTDFLLEVLAFCTASCIDTISGSEESPVADVLLAELGTDMADWWSPTVESYLGQVPKPRIIGALTDVGIDEFALRDLDKLKKIDLAKKAEELLAGSHWLPAFLRPKEPPKPPAKKARSSKRGGG
ncbi:ParB family chromosome partitioning protein [Paraburkholderia sp. HC6.4b]|uniref:ParB/RepB/Spo0J family partition protein n=1 Tax=unclassified Paraburkholderia TaxID=2615204 RepID=UPI001621133E|nr:MULTISPECIES: ParB/RepB/Spo0J family partition protein [unclassified Paraburkholderia]MBB5411863.1 ParB family chromosome partitioning protein [Paraburkholderia sp. HC6.4b]MBB5450175.1 ParB family chromosome partitioning protein [Paraburkholderia sp. Kb1A]